MTITARSSLGTALLVAFCASPATASPIDYTFSGVLGHRTADPGGIPVYDGWADQIITGWFAFDADSSTYTGWHFDPLSGTAFTWLGPLFPVPPSVFFPPWQPSVQGDASSVHFGLFLPSPILEQFDVYLYFSQPLGTTGVVSAGGSIDRFGAPGNLIFPFVSGSVVSTPEPSTWLLLGLGLLGLGLKARARRIQAQTMRGLRLVDRRVGPSSVASDHVVVRLTDQAR